ncbi:flotillin family protein [candidate division CSSED10-310 bacterium]|uniref:Flotillin family protein n=1 Tax=candidate division CSSED10-310 bacterium TaxID=2855610 RepID=A0ABV6YW25_UNCC1
MSIVLYILLIAVILVIIGIAVAVPLQYKKVGPNEVLIITGGRYRSITLPDGTIKKVGYRVRIGGGTLVWPVFEAYQILSLQIIGMDFEVKDVIAQNGINSTITGTAQVKINGADPQVHLAAEQFLGKSQADIKEVALKTIEGHARSIIGTLNLEQLNKARREFSAQLFENVQPDFDRMGLILISFNLKDIKDPSGYLEALGRPVIALAKRDAEVAQAEANRDAVIKSAYAKKEGDIAKLKAETEVAEVTKDFEMRRAEFQATINEKKAISDYTYDLERQKMSKLVKEEEHKVKLIEKENDIAIAQKEIDRSEFDLEATVKKPALAEKFRLTQEAEAMAEAKKIQGLVEAELTQNQGQAEAAAMKQKAEAWRSYNDAAMIHQLVEILPQLAREISEPLSKIEKIVMVNSGSDTSGVSKITGDVAEVLAQLPTVVESLTGVDLKKMLARLPQAGQKKDSPESDPQPQD